MSAILFKDALLSLTSPAHGPIIKGASLLVGGLGFMLSIITTVLQSFFPSLLYKQPPRLPPSRSSSRHQVRRITEITEDKPSASSFAAPSTSPISIIITHPVSSSSQSTHPKSTRSLKPSSSVPVFPTVVPLAPPINDYFPPMDSMPTSDAAHCAPAEDALHGSQLAARPTVDCKPAMSTTDKRLRESRSMSFFRTKGQPKSRSQPKRSISPLSDPGNNEKKKKPLAVRPRTQPYEAPYFLPYPSLPSSPENLHVRPTAVRSQTLPPPPRKTS